MWENAYLGTKNSKASRARLRALDPAADSSLHYRDSASLRRQLSASEAGCPLDQILDPHLGYPCIPGQFVKSWSRIPPLNENVHLENLEDSDKCGETVCGD